MITKYCSRCFLNLPLTEYKKDKKELDGYKKICKECIDRKDYEPRKPKVDVPVITYNERGGLI